ncbi:hypothetical protein ACJO1P_05640 [Vibrio parahaemolyticus]|uniref:hypothetical protein n=1 Tax=Vibrio parahaemolyticus TaxID=670 RepID=UPI00387B4C5D
MTNIELKQEIEILRSNSKRLEGRSPSLIHNPAIIDFEMDRIIDRSIKIISKLKNNTSPELKEVKLLLDQKKSPLHDMKTHPTENGIAEAGRFGQRIAKLCINYIKSK